ncbi:MAG: WD40/YVTN/BNR-like repeat-containing protein, partial [Planctomycetota bacterium]
MNHRRFAQAGRVFLVLAAIGFNSFVVADDQSKGSFTINQGVSGAWFNAQTAGQGFLIDVEPDSQFIFVAWFTFDQASSKVGAAGQRWLTAQGQYSGGSAELPLFVTSGGVFDDPQGVDTQQDGTLSITFSDCSNGTIDYALDGEGLQGQVAITRVIPGSEDLCETAGAKLADKGASFFMPTAGPTGGDVFRMHRHSNGDLFLGGFLSGRLYRSSDNGQNWSPSMFTSPPFNWIDDFASGPDGALYIANACGFSQCDAEAGVYRSTDGGDTFELLGLNNVEVSAVFAGDGVILAGTQGNAGSIRRSTDGGTSFFQALGGIELVRQFAQSPAGTIFAAEAQGIYRSTNNGGAWTRTLDLPCCSDTAVVVDADGVVFASHIDGVFRSTDDGLTWVAADSGIPRTDGSRRIVHLAVDDDGDLAVARFGGGGVYTSFDDGNSWQSIGDSQIADSSFVTDLIYGNDGALLFVADSLGVLRTDDDGGNWSRSNEGLLDTTVGELYVASNGDLYANAGGELHRTQDRGATWERLKPPVPLGFLGGAYGLGPNDEIYAGSGADGSMVVSTDAGQTWNSLNPPWEGEEQSGVTFIASNADGELFVTVFDNFAGNGDQSGIYRSTDGGASFVAVNDGLPPRDANFSDAPGPSRIGIAPDGALLVGLEVFDPVIGNFTAP